MWLPLALLSDGFKTALRALRGSRFRFVRTGELQKDLLKTPRCGAQLIQIPACFDDSSGEVRSNGPVCLTLHFENKTIVATLLQQNAANAGHLFEASFHLRSVRRLLASGN